MGEILGLMGMIGIVFLIIYASLILTHTHNFQK